MKNINWALVIGIINLLLGIALLAKYIYFARTQHIDYYQALICGIWCCFVGYKLIKVS